MTRADRQSREAGKACWQLPEGEGEGEALEKERRAVQISKAGGRIAQARPLLQQSLEIHDTSRRFFLLSLSAKLKAGTLNRWWEGVEPWTCHWVAPLVQQAWPPPPKLIQNLHPQPFPFP